MSGRSLPPEPQPAYLSRRSASSSGLSESYQKLFRYSVDNLLEARSRQEKRTKPPMTVQPSQKVANKLSGMDRQGLMRTLRSLRCKFELDFTDDYLDKVSLERLRHITMAAILHAQNA